MQTFLHIVTSIVSLGIYVMQLLMLARAILSWIPFQEDSPVQRFLFCATEPLIIPIRNLLSRSERLSALPIDLSFLFAYIILSILAILI